MNTNEKKRFVLLVDNNVYEKFKSLAQEQNRTAGNLGTTLINEYVKEHYKNNVMIYLIFLYLTFHAKIFS